MYCFYCRKIEEKRGVTVTDSGIPEVKPSLSANGLQSQVHSQVSSNISGNVSSATNNRPAWDEEWGPIRKQPSSSLQTNSVTPTNPIMGNEPIQVSSSQPNSFLQNAVSSQQTAASCPPVDIEWPPQASSGVTPQFGDAEKQSNAGASPTSSFDDIDPFANWPPRPSGSVSGSGPSNNGTTGFPANIFGSSSLSSTSNSMNSNRNSNNSWTFDTQSSVEQIRLNQGNATSNTGSLGNSGFNPQNSLGYLKQNQATPASSAYTNKNSSDLGSIFASGKNDHTAPRLAPPPSTAVGRGRGRGKGASSVSRSSHAKSSTEQPPLLDLL